MRKTRVYVAGPITGEGASQLLPNVRTACLAGTELLDLGYAPYVPHLNCFWEVVAPGEQTDSYAQWLALDKAFLLACDALLRLPGKSPGADQEIMWAEKAGIPVYYKLEHLQTNLGPTTECAPWWVRAGDTRGGVSAR